MEEFENINIILTERAFKDNMFRTKCHVEHMNADKKIEQLTRLLNTHDVKWSEENIDTYTQGNLQSVQNTNLREKIFNTDQNLTQGLSRDYGNTTQANGPSRGYSSITQPNGLSKDYGSPELRTEGMNTNYGHGSSFKKRSASKENGHHGFN